MPVLEQNTQTGDPIQVGDTTITPKGRALRFNLPGFPGGFVWNRPSAVIVKTADGMEQVLPVNDVTRWAVWMFLAAGMVGGLLVWLIFRKNR